MGDDALAGIQYLRLPFSEKLIHHIDGRRLKDFSHLLVVGAVTFNSDRCNIFLLIFHTDLCFKSAYTGEINGERESFEAM